jgi:hypothetical protein
LRLPADLDGVDPVLGRFSSVLGISKTFALGCYPIHGKQGSDYITTIPDNMDQWTLREKVMEVQEVKNIVG